VAYSKVHPDQLSEARVTEPRAAVDPRAMAKRAEARVTEPRVAVDDYGEESDPFAADPRIGEPRAADPRASGSRATKTRADVGAASRADAGAASRADSGSVSGAEVGAGPSARAKDLSLPPDAQRTQTWVATHKLPIEPDPRLILVQDPDG